MTFQNLKEEKTLPGRFCPVCGKPVSFDEVKRFGTCKVCYYKSHPLFTLEKKSLFIQICPTCLKYRNLEESDKDKAWYVPEQKDYKTVWSQAIYHFLVSKIKVSDDIDFSIDFTREPEVLDTGKKKTVWLDLVGKTRDDNGSTEDEREETTRVQLRYSIGTCNDCAQKRVGYHNSVVQLRASMKREETESLIEEMKQDIIEFTAKTEYHGTNQISGIEEVPGGIDIKFMSKQLGKSVVNHLRKKYCVEVKESFRITGPDKEKGGNLSRSFHVIRIYPFLPGDVMLFKRSGEPCLILRVSPTMVHLISLAKGRLEHARPDTFTEEDLIFQGGKDPFVEFQVVSINELYGTMNLMRLDNYEERVESIKEWLCVEKEGSMIKGFFFADALYLFPLEMDLDYDEDNVEA